MYYNYGGYGWHRKKKKKKKKKAKKRAPVVYTPEKRQKIRDWQAKNPEKQKKYLADFYAKHGGQAAYMREWNARKKAKEKQAAAQPVDPFDKNPDFNDKEEESLRDKD